MRYSILFAFALSTACSTVRELPADKFPVDGKAVQVKNDDVLAYNIAIDVDAPPSTIWPILTDARSFPTWNSTIQSLDGEIAQGKQIALVTKSQPDQTYKLTVSELVPEQRMVWEDGMPLGMFQGVRTFTLRADQDGSTIVTMSEVLSGGMLGMIGDSIPDMRPAFDAFAADLKKTAEARAPAAPSGDASAPATTTP